MRTPGLVAFSLAVTLAFATLAAPAAAQRAPKPHVLATLPGTPEQPARTSAVWLTRDRAGRLYLAAPEWGVTVHAPGGGVGRRLGGRDGETLSGSLGWMGDTLTVSSFRRAEMVRPDGGYVGCRSPGHTGEFDTQLFDSRPIAGGLYVGELRPPWAGTETGEALVVARGVRQSEVVRTLARRPPRPRYVSVPMPSGGGSWNVPPPLFTVPEWSVADDGGAAIVADQAAPAGPGAQTVRVTRLRMSGDTLYSVELKVPAVAVDEAWRERQIREWVLPSSHPEIVPDDTAGAFAAFRRAVAFPAYHPPVAAVVAGADGSAWLRLASGGDLATWVRLDPAGAERERVALPEAFRALYADGDGVWGVLPAPDGSARVVQFPDARPFADGTLEIPAPSPEPRRAGAIMLHGGCPPASR